jgi:hypothetical protein
LRACVRSLSSGGATRRLLAHPGMTNKSAASRACETPASFG